MNGERLDDFIESLWQSRLVDLDLLGDLRRASASSDLSPGVLAADLVERGILTPFQADWCLAGGGHGLKLGRYRFLDLLGEGTLGRVYRALHETTEQVVAVKVLHPETIPDAEAAHRFHREAEAARWLAHPHLVKVLDDGLQDGVHYLVTEHVEAVALDRYLAQHGPLAPPLACRFAHQAALALQSMFERRFVPSDLRSSDLIVREQSQTVKLLAAGQGRLGPSAQGLGEFEFGPLLDRDFDPPEDASAAALAALREDVQAALRGLGRVLQAMLEGGPEPPPALGAVLARMLASEPSERFETPDECAEALAPFCGPDPEPEPDPEPASVPAWPEPSPGVEVPGSEVLPESASGLSGAPVLAEAATLSLPAAPRPRGWAGTGVLFLLGLLLGSGLTLLADGRLDRFQATPPLLALARLASPEGLSARPGNEAAGSEGLRSDPGPQDSGVVGQAQPLPPPEPKANEQAASTDPVPPLVAPANEPSPEAVEKPVETVFVKPAEPAVQKPAEPPAITDEEYDRLISSGDEEMKNNRLDEAIAAYSEAIRAKPDLAAAYIHRALGLNGLGRRREVIADCNRAIARDPHSYLAYRLRAGAMISLGDAGGAIADANQAIELNPKDACSYNIRGVAYFMQGRHLEAVRDLTQSVRIDDSLANSQGNLAWVLANASDSAVRNGPLAVKYATNACVLTRWADPTQLNNLAAAYNECGAYEQAVQYQGLALRSSQNLDAVVVEQYETRLKLYRKRLTARESAKPPNGAGLVRLVPPPRANPGVPVPPPPVPAFNPPPAPSPAPTERSGPARPRINVPRQINSPATDPHNGKQAGVDRVSRSSTAAG
jgi:tetratricopeptide (TPR) repeat protein